MLLVMCPVCLLCVFQGSWGGFYCSLVKLAAHQCPACPPFCRNCCPTPCVPTLLAVLLATRAPQGLLLHVRNAWPLVVLALPRSHQLLSCEKQPHTSALT